MPCTCSSTINLTIDADLNLRYGDERLSPDNSLAIEVEEGAMVSFVLTNEADDPKGVDVTVELQVPGGTTSAWTFDPVNSWMMSDQPIPANRGVDFNYYDTGSGYKTGRPAPMTYNADGTVTQPTWPVRDPGVDVVNRSSRSVYPSAKGTVLRAADGNSMQFKITAPSDTAGSVGVDVCVQDRSDETRGDPIFTITSRPPTQSGCPCQGS